MQETEDNNNKNKINERNKLETLVQCLTNKDTQCRTRPKKRSLFWLFRSKPALLPKCASASCSTEPISCSLPKETCMETVGKKELGLRSFNRTQVIVLLVLVLSNFLCYCSMSVMAPFFPIEAKEKGMGIFLAGCVFSFYALIVFITSPIFGKVLPKFGAKPLFIGGMLLCGLSNECFGLLANTNNYAVFTLGSFIIRGMEALGAAAFSTSSFVFVLEMYPDNVSTVLGVMETFIGLGLSVGPAIGGVLYTIGGFGLPFFLLGAVMIGAIPICFGFLPSINKSSKDEDEGSFWKLLKVPSALVISLVIIHSSNIWSFLDPTLQPHLEKISLTSKEVGFVFLLFSAVYALFSLICGWIADKVDNHWSMMVIGLLISAGSLMVLGPSPLLKTESSTVEEVLISISVLSASIALTMMPTFQALLKCAVKSGQKKDVTTYSLVAGTWASMYSLGDVIGPVLGGMVLDNYGFPILATVMAFITLVVAGVALMFFVCRDCCTNYNADLNLKPLLDEKYIYYGGVSESTTVGVNPSCSGRV